MTDINRCSPDCLFIISDVSRTVSTQELLRILARDCPNDFMLGVSPISEITSSELPRKE